MANQNNGTETGYYSLVHTHTNCAPAKLRNQYKDGDTILLQNVWIYRTTQFVNNHSNEILKTAKLIISSTLTAAMAFELNPCLYRDSSVTFSCNYRRIYTMLCQKNVEGVQKVMPPYLYLYPQTRHHLVNWLFRSKTQTSENCNHSHEDRTSTNAEMLFYLRTKTSDNEQCDTQ